MDSDANVAISRSTASRFTESVGITSASSLPARGTPACIAASQSYYFKKLWQEGEAEALRDLEEGHSRRFDNAREAVRWLLSDEEQD